MQSRPIGQPITAAQRRAFTETPDSEFATRFQAAYQAACSAAPGEEQGSPAPSSPSGAGNARTSALSGAQLEAILGARHTQLSELRGVSADCQTRYAALLERAYSSGGLSDAKGFLTTLTPAELDDVRRNHCLADPIDPASLSDEGAQNLLLPEGFRVDLNGDGMDEVGCAFNIPFPPRDAPADFKEAWFQATATLDEGSMMTYALQMHIGLYGIPIDNQPSAPRVAIDQLASYQQLVSQILTSLDVGKPWMAEGQYERDKAFFTRFLGELQSV